MAATTSQPIPEAQLKMITKDACDTTFSTATSYQHTQTETWNASIINKILNSLISTAAATSSSSEPTPAQKPQYKYAVTSTIIQHLEPTTSTATTGTSTDGQTASPPGTPEVNGESSVVPSKGKRGMHSATGAYWNNTTDGMYSYKWAAGEEKGMDVVVSIIWIAV